MNDPYDVLNEQLGKYATVSGRLAGLLQVLRENTPIPTCLAPMVDDALAEFHHIALGVEEPGDSNTTNPVLYIDNTGKVNPVIDDAEPVSPEAAALRDIADFWDRIEHLRPLSSTEERLRNATRAVLSRNEETPW